MALSEEEKRARQLQAVKRYRARHPERHRMSSRKTAKKWRSANLERARAQNTKWRLSDPRNMMVAAAKSRAKKKGIPFSITIEHVPVPEFCPLLGIPLFVSKGKHAPNSPSIDRLRPELGYVPGNVWVISHRANAMKTNFTLAQLEHFVSTLRNRLQNF